MKAEAWIRNPDPQPRGLVFRMEVAALKPWWAGVVTVLDKEWDVRTPLIGPDDFAISSRGDTREEALEELAPLLEEARRAAGQPG